MSAPRFKAGDIVLDKVFGSKVCVIAGPGGEDSYAVQEQASGRFLARRADNLRLIEPTDEPEELAVGLLEVATPPPLTVHVDFVELLRWADESPAPTASMRVAVAGLRDLLEAAAS